MPDARCESSLHCEFECAGCFCIVRRPWVERQFIMAYLKIAMIRRWLALTYYLYALRLATLSHFYFNPLYCPPILD